MSVTVRVKATGQVFEVTTDMDGDTQGRHVEEFIDGKLYGGLLFDSLETEPTGTVRLKGYRQWATFRTEELEVFSLRLRGLGKRDRPAI
ncbi:MAG TPA: hypothetical protein VGR96_19010 [Acidobacteriaceae bacterium]|nr:hypothetical protein [Acidobacteriaceae bacterium]